MKAKIFLSVCIITLLFQEAFAQTDTTERMNRDRFDYKTDTVNKIQADSLDDNQRSHTGTQDSLSSDGIMMQKGRMMIIRNGKMSAINRDTTLSNGMIVMKDGVIILSDGTRKVLKEGERINMSGQAVPAGEKNKDMKSDKVNTTRDTTSKKKDMYLVPDSMKKHYEKK